jgi:glucosamine-6-phosphate deaminase
MHRQATVVLDEEAASNLRLRDYYETVHPAGAEARLP